MKPVDAIEYVKQHQNEIARAALGGNHEAKNLVFLVERRRENKSPILDDLVADAVDAYIEAKKNKRILTNELQSVRNMG